MDAIVKRALLAVLALAAAPVLAEDPTRPPPELIAPARGAPAAAPRADGLALQAVLRKPGHPPGAMINGWILRPGQSVNGVKLAAVGESHADVLVGGERVRLSLTPEVRRSEHVDPPAAAAPAPARGRKNKGNS